MLYIFPLVFILLIFLLIVNATPGKMPVTYEITKLLLFPVGIAAEIFGKLDIPSLEKNKYFFYSFIGVCVALTSLLWSLMLATFTTAWHYKNA